MNAVKWYSSAMCNVLFIGGGARYQMKWVCMRLLHLRFIIQLYFLIQVLSKSEIPEVDKEKYVFV